MNTTINQFEPHRLWPDLNLSVMLCRHSEDENPGFHSHDFYEMVLVCRGSALHYMNSEALPIRAGNILLVPPGCIHGYLNPEDLHIYNILFCRDILESLQGDLALMPSFQLLFQVQPHLDSGLRHTAGLLSLSREHFERALNLCRTITEEIKNREPGARTLVHGMFLSLMVHCLRHAEQDSRSSGSYAGQISSVLATLDRHPEKRWTLAEMAKTAGMSTPNFRLHFRRLTGHAPGSYLLELRLKKAADILQSGDSPVSEIAFRTGFHDANYFSRQFHRFYGKSPRDFRR